MSKPFFTVVTPTLQRESLVQCCSTVDSQTFKSWQHIVQADSAELNADLIKQIENPQREIYSCGKHHNNGGNSCRRLALERATGDYIIFRDDDNYTPDERIFEDIAEALESAGRPAWGLFPISRLGGRFYTDPPRSCHVDTMNVVLRRDIAYWPDTDAYGTDGILVDDLMARKVPYVAFPCSVPSVSFHKSAFANRRWKMNPVLVLTHNGLEMNKVCVTSALNQDIPTWVYLVDNDSQDHTYEWAKTVENIVPVQFSPQIGVSGGWNHGLKTLFECEGAEHVLVVNSDVVLPRWFYSSLLSYDGPFISGVSVDNMDTIANPEPRKELGPCPDFSAFMLADVLETVGPFDETMSLYAQDLDRHIRSHRAGVPLMNAGVPFYHERQVRSIMPLQRKNEQSRCKPMQIASVLSQVRLPYMVP